MSQQMGGRSGRPAANRAGAAQTLLALRRQGFPRRQTGAGAAQTLQKKNIHVLRVPDVLRARARPGAMSAQVLRVPAVVPKRIPAVVTARRVETANYKHHNRQGSQKSAIPLSSPHLLGR